MKRFYFLAPTVVALATQFSFGQAGTMSLMGNVQSDDRRALPGAAITVIHVPSGTRYAAASNATGTFSINNLQAGGPYLMQVGEGGYHPQTLESIFLEKGKTVTFTVTLNRLSAGGKEQRPSRVASAPTPTETLAAESVVGGPVLLTTGGGATASSQRDAPAMPPPAAAASAPAPAAAPARAPYKRYVRRTTPPVADPIVPGHYDAKSGNYVYETGRLTTLQLPGGQVISDVGVNSTESNLHRFLTDPQAQVDTVDLTRGWYNFDRVFFTPGKATLTPESVDQLSHVAALLKAYPKARIKLGGYTDSTGTYKVNKQLSDARARTAWAALVELGISPSRIDARGYGPRYAIASNQTDEGRAKNRRLSVKVLAK
ncbi:MAG TPA: OmpA family protein [Hymenobacter sp.]|jgi:outer membrane protein OmpA-like peptidoglycan-associated protein|uniref:OmpA family protein n=1 Tax=Hymenobacter sp. TaxID=1898978 RepID=UPI002ED83DE9